MQVLQSAGERTHTQFHNDPKILVVDGSMYSRYVPSYNLVPNWVFGIFTIIEPK